MDNDLILYFLIIYSTVQLFFISAAAVWFFRIQHNLGLIRAEIWDLNNEIVHHAVALHDAGMIPLPWEGIEEDLTAANECPSDTNGTRRNGNVYYLVDDD